jgi:hypothetical protein
MIGYCRPGMFIGKIDQAAETCETARDISFVNRKRFSVAVGGFGPRHELDSEQRSARDFWVKL